MIESVPEKKLLRLRQTESDVYALAMFDGSLSDGSKVSQVKRVQRHRVTY